MAIKNDGVVFPVFQPLAMDEDSMEKQVDLKNQYVYEEKSVESALLEYLYLSEAKFSFGEMDKIPSNERAHLLIRNGEYRKLDCWLSKRHFDPNAKNCQGEALLHSAVKRGQVNFVDLLIRRKASIDMKDKAGQTPLEVAIRFSQQFIAMKLVNSGADTKIFASTGEPIIELVDSSKMPRLASLLSKKT